jgi:hypothetical protein
MAIEHSDVLASGNITHPVGPPPLRLARIRPWAWMGIAAQVVFVVSWLAAAFWQGSRYSVVKQSISDMYALTAPHGVFLVILYTICGAATIGFALFSARPTLRPGGRAATVGSVLLALSVAGLGDLLSPFERLACRAADPGCTTATAVSNSGGKLDGNLTGIGVLLLVVAAFFLAHAMQRTPGWRAWAPPTRWTAVLIVALTIAEALTKANTGFYGLIERLIAVTVAAGLAALGIGILRRSREGGGLGTDLAIAGTPQPASCAAAHWGPPLPGEGPQQVVPGDDRTPARPRPPGWTSARIASVVIGAVLVLCSVGLLTAGGAALWAQTAKGPGGYLNLGARTYATDGYAVATDKIRMPTATGGWSLASALFGTMRLQATPARGNAPVFVGVAPAAAAARYLGGVSYSTVTNTTTARPVYAVHGGGPPAVPPTHAGIWVAHAAGPGPQVLTWPVKSGTWTVVTMNADGSRPVGIRVTNGATLPALLWLAGGLLAGGLVVGAIGVTLIVVPLHRVSNSRPNLLEDLDQNHRYRAA